MYSYHLRVFRAVATYRSYSRAAREALYISQPAVSKHVQALEAELGVKLFQRVGKHIELTEAGVIVLQYADQMHTLTDETRSALLALQGLQRGTLRLGASNTVGTYLLPPILAAFAERYPGITLAVELSNSQQVIAGMLERRWSLGFAGNVPAHFPLHLQPYGRDPLVLIVPPSHRLATRETVALGELVGEPWVVREPGSASRQVVEQALRRHHIPWQPRLALPSNEAIKQAVMAGLGIGMVSRLAVTLEVQQGLLCVIPLGDLRVERQISILQRHEVKLPPAAQAFLRLLDQWRPSRRRSWTFGEWLPMKT